LLTVSLRRRMIDSTAKRPTFRETSVTTTSCRPYRRKYRATASSVSAMMSIRSRR
jgi:hypothetical protein